MPGEKEYTHEKIKFTKNITRTCCLSVLVLEHILELVKGKEPYTGLGGCSNDECRQSSVNGCDTLCPDCCSHDVDRTFELLQRQRKDTHADERERVSLLVAQEL